MTALEYMEKQFQKHYQNYGREVQRGAPEQVLENIKSKISYYKDAVDALQKTTVEIVYCQDCRYCKKDTVFFNDGLDTYKYYCNYPLREGGRWKNSFCEHGDRGE